MFEILYPYRPTKMRPLLCLVIVLGCVRGDAFDEVNYGVKYANDCEVCKIVSKEILMLLKESEKKREVLETGYSVQVNTKSLRLHVDIAVVTYVPGGVPLLRNNRPNRLCWEGGSLHEMKARICPSGKLLCLWTYKTIETVYKGH